MSIELPSDRSIEARSNGLAARAAIQIEKDIPLPQRQRNDRYPWAQMDVGDSFAVPSAGPNGKRLHAAASKAAQVLSIKLTCRTLTENGVRVVRVWRIA